MGLISETESSLKTYRELYESALSMGVPVEVLESYGVLPEVSSIDDVPDEAFECLCNLMAARCDGAVLNSGYSGDRLTCRRPVPETRGTRTYEYCNNFTCPCRYVVHGAHVQNGTEYRLGPVVGFPFQLIRGSFYEDVSFDARDVKALGYAEPVVVSRYMEHGGRVRILYTQLSENSYRLSQVFVDFDRMTGARSRYVEDRDILDIGLKANSGSYSFRYNGALGLRRLYPYRKWVQLNPEIGSEGRQVSDQRAVQDETDPFSDVPLDQRWPYNLWVDVEKYADETVLRYKVFRGYSCPLNLVQIPNQILIPTGVSIPNSGVKNVGPRTMLIAHDTAVLIDNWIQSWKELFPVVFLTYDGIPGGLLH